MLLKESHLICNACAAEGDFGSTNGAIACAAEGDFGSTNGDFGSADICSFSTFQI
jgi:hypothetical protein